MKEDDGVHRRRRKKKEKKRITIFNPELSRQYYTLFYRYDRGKVVTENKEEDKK
ncbi:MAG: hypothetical protein J5697_03155 [Clostridia bacterium]|nr:hypothetical protein [Clostridia bacterium]